MMACAADKLRGHARVAEHRRDRAHLVEALMAATAQSDPIQKARVKGFLCKRPPKKVIFDDKTTSVDA
jgi:hypothetical protein